MPRFHFNIYDGVSLPDEDGTDLPDARNARREAIILAGAVLKDSAKSDTLGDEWRLEVTDNAGLLLFKLDFTVTESPAAKVMGAR